MKVKSGKILLSFFASLIFAASAQAATFTANADGNWTAAIWTIGGVDGDGIPDADDTVTIPSPRVVTVTGAQSAHILTVNTGGTLTLGASATLTLDGTAGSEYSGAGTVNGTGTFRTQGTTFFGGSSLFTAPLEINSGTTTGSGNIGGSLTILNGATYTSNNSSYTIGGNLTVNAGGTLTVTNGTITANGTNLVNNGTINASGAFNFGGGAGNLSGTGVFIGNYTFLNGSPETLTSGVTIGNGATASSLTVNTGGSLATNGNTLILNGVAASGAGAVTGAGIVRMQGTSSITLSANLTAPLEINSGTTTGSGNIGGSLTILNGAAYTSNNSSYIIGGNLTVNAGGTLTVTNGTITANGANIVNNGTITGGFTFGGTGTQNLSGAGALTGSITILNGSVTNLTGDVTFGNGIAATTLAVNTGGTLAVGIYTLTFNRVSLSGAGALTSAAAGKLRTQGVSSISVSAAFTGFLEVNSGTTTASGSVGGSLTVLSGTTLDTVNQNFTVSGDLTNSGTITKTSGNFNANGANIVNNGTITGGGFNFGGGGTQNLSGTGSISSDATILSGSTVALGSNHQLATLAVNSGGTLNTSTFTLFLNGAGTPLSGAGTIANVNITYNGAAAQTVQTAASYNRLGVDNAAGVTLSSAETVNQRLILTNGAFNNGAFLTIANGATIERSNGTLQTAPTLGGVVNVEYTGAANVTTGVEFPTANLTVNNLTVNKTAAANTVTLNADRSLVGALTLTNGQLLTGAFKIALADASTSTGSANGYVIGKIEKSFSSPASFVFHIGTATGYSPATINATPTGFGTFAVSAVNGIIPGSALDPAKSLQRYWSLTQTDISQANITFQYPQADVPGTANENLFRFTRNNAGGGNTYYTPSALDTTNNVATLNNVTQFSNWTLYDLIASAASVSVAGRVSGEMGGISNAIVNLTDSSGNVRMARTNPFGYFSFENVAVGQTYVVSVSSKKYQFSPQVITIVEDVSDLNFSSISK